jgi:two-component system, cell cycle sensor histidine kinase and response regulator CckA
MLQLQKRPAVLVVDDEPRILTSMTALLEDDFAVLTSTNAEQALGILEEKPCVVIIADQRMPGLTGDEFLAKAKNVSQATRILITGYADISALVRAVNDGQIYTYVAKPWEPRELRSAVIKAAEHCLLTKEVERERNLLHALMDNLPDAIWFKDNACRFTQVNKAAASMLNTGDPLAVIGKTIFDFLPSDQAREIQAQDEKIVQTGRADTNQIQELRFNSNGTRWMSTTRAPVLERTGGVAAIVGVSRDITEQKQAEVALRESEQKYRQIVETAAEGVWIFDDLLRTIFVNSRMAEMLGCKPEEMQGKPVSDFMADEDIAAQLSYFEQCNLGGRTPDLRLRKKDGTMVWAILSSSPMTEGLGHPSGTLAMFTDVTERKRLEDQIRQAQKLEAIGRLAGGVAHDFNNILTVISGHSQLLLRRMESGSALRGQVEKIGAAADQAANLTRQLLSFSRRRAVQSEVFDLNTAVSNFEKLCYPIMGDAIELVTDLDAEAARIRADAGQIDQVLMNLVVNARDAMPEGGRLGIATANIEDPGSESHPAGAYVLLAVSDTGCGMDEDTKAHLFEPFFTTKEEGKGTGLGLSTVHGIVAQHGGWIDVISAPGQGSCFGIYLPRISDEVQVVPLPENQALWPHGRETVLVVDDRAAIRDLVRETLEPCGYKILEASDGQEGLEVFERTANQVDLVITDLIMPRLGGAELGRLIKQRRPETKILYVTGYSGESPIVEAGGTLLQKPFTPEALARKVRETLSGPSSSRSILIVDDDPEVLNLLRFVLEGEGYDIRSAQNGREAMAQLKEVPVGIILTDLAMPEQDGIETILAVRKEYPNLRVIAMSGTFASSVLDAARHLGADAVLAKPIEVDEMLKTLQELQQRSF